MNRSQGQIIDKLQRYMAIKNPKVDTKLDGLCFGLSVCVGTMYVLGKLDWWDAAIDVVLTWDGSEHSLKELVHTPNSMPDTAVTRESILERMYHYVIFNHADVLIDDKYKLTQNTFLNANQQFEAQNTDGNVLKIQTSNKIMGHFQYESDLIQALDDQETKAQFSNAFGMIFSQRHGCELHYTDNKWWFYDPNYYDGKLHQFDTTKALVREITRVLGIDIGIHQVNFKVINATSFDYLNNNSCLGTLLEGNFLSTMILRVPELTLKLLTKHKDELDQSHLSPLLINTESTLGSAIYYNQKEIAELLIAKLDHEKLVDTISDTQPLIWAIQCNQLEIAKLIINRLSGEELALQDGNKVTALIMAVCLSHTEIAKLLIQRMRDEDLSIQNSYNFTALHYAIGFKQLEIAKLLINRSNPEDLLKQDRNGLTPLMYAANSGLLEIVNLILNKMPQSFLSIQDNKGRNALIQAAAYGHLPCISALIDKIVKINPADLMMKTSSEENVLCHTITSNQINAQTKIAVASYLLDTLPREALNDSNSDGCTPLILAVQQGLGCPALFQHHKLITDFNAKNKAGMTALYYAAKLNNQIMANFIIDKLDKDELNPRTPDGATPLMVAAENGHLNIVNLLLDKMIDSDIHSQNKMGCTALMLAIKNGHLAVVLAMLQKTSLTDVLEPAQGNQFTAGHLIFSPRPSKFFILKNKENMNALMIAIASKQDQVVNELLKFHQDFDETIHFTIDQCLQHLKCESAKLAMMKFMRQHYGKFHGSASAEPITILHLALFTENDQLISKLLKLHAFDPTILSDCLLIADVMRHCSQHFKNCHELLLAIMNEQTINQLIEEHTTDFTAPTDDVEPSNREFIPLQSGQKWLVDRMNSAEISWNLINIDYGAAALHMNAMLSGYSQVERFDYRLVMISKLPMYTAHQFNHRKMVAESENALPVSLSNGLQYISPDNKGVFLEIPAALQVMYVYNNSFNFKAMLPTSATSYSVSFHKQSTILQSNQVSALGGTNPVHMFTAAFTRTELTEILMGLEQSAKESGIPHLIPCLMRSLDSNFTLGFDPKHHTWMIFDVKQAPTKYYPVEFTDAHESQPLSQKDVNTYQGLVDQLFKSAKSTDEYMIVVNWQIMCVEKNAKDFLRFKDLFTTHPSYIKHMQLKYNKMIISPNTHHFNSLLLLIARNDDVETLVQVLQSGYFPCIKPIQLWDTILHKAAANNSTKVIKAIMQHKEHDIKTYINIKNYRDRTPLAIAVMCNNFKAAKLLLDHGANVHVHHQSNDDDMTTLLGQAIYNDNLEMVRLLLDANAFKDDLFLFGVNALCYAIKRNQTEIALELIERGALFSQIGRIKTHALSYAINSSNQIVIEKLLSSNCDLGNVDIIKVITDLPQMLPQFMDHGFNINCFDTQHLTALMRACYRDDIKILKRLLELGADPTVAHINRTSLTCAIDAKNTNALSLLLDHCDREYIHHHGAALLHYALIKESTNDGMIKCLVEHGCGVDYINPKDGITSIQRAIQKGQCSIVEVMLMQGANPFQHTDKNETAVSLFPEVIKHIRLRKLLEKVQAFYALIQINFNEQSPRREAQLALLKTIIHPKLSMELCIRHIERFAALDSTIQAQLIRLQAKASVSPDKQSYYLDKADQLSALYRKLSTCSDNYDSLLTQYEEVLRLMLVTSDKRRITNDLKFFKDTSSEIKESSTASHTLLNAANM